jgi:DnaJ-class molecular chaperone
MRHGCGCGIFEPSFENEKRARDWKRQAADARETAERWLRNAERWEEIAKRLAACGTDCEACDGRGYFDFMGDGRTEYETCNGCQGYGVTEGVTCADHDEAKGDAGIVTLDG